MGLGDGRKQSPGIGEDPSKDAGNCGPLSLLGIHAINYLPGHRVQGPKPRQARKGSIPGERAQDPRKPLRRRRNVHSCGSSQTALQG